MEKEIYNLNELTEKNREVPLINKEQIDPEMTFELKSEPGVITDKGDSAFWVKLKSEKDNPALEGKFFTPGEKTEKLIVFTLGLLGDGNKWMESKFIPSLLREGYIKDSKNKFLISLRPNFYFSLY